VSRKELPVFKKLDHVEIVTDHPDRSVEFYTRVLGFEVKLRQDVKLPGGSGTLDIVYLDLGGTAIELMSYRGLPVGPAPQKEHHGYRLMALEVESMKEALEYLKTKGVGPSWGPVALEIYTRAEIRDPDGYSIELREWHPSRAAAMKGAHEKA
jgi:catechol 2,3-dioxygenase-like lactoylglutathione lyase family enzyme